MYAAHFNLREPPFSIAPDPSFLYLSSGHQEALGHLLYGTGQYGGFVQLTGEVGTGKTTIVRSLLNEKLENVDVAMIHNPRQSELEFVAAICDELGVKYAQPANSIKMLVDALNEYLLTAHAAGRRTVLIIDEAQNLAPEVLEQVRLLTNLETDKEKLLRIMLVGQPELDALLARPELRQLASRITARARLSPLTAADTERYIVHRLRVAGGAADLFTPAAIRRVHRYANGIPRLINVICDRALLGAYAKGFRSVSSSIVDQAAAEALGSRAPGESWVNRLRKRLPQGGSLLYVEAAMAIAALIVAGAVAWQLLGGGHHRRASVAAVPAAPLADADGSNNAAPTKNNEVAVAPKPVTVEPTPVESSTARKAADRSTGAATNGVPDAKPVVVDADLGALRVTTESLPQVMSRLIALWNANVRIPRGENVCHALAVEQLACYKSHATWEDLAQFDRPAILTLKLTDGSVQYVLLRSLDTDHAVLETSGGLLRFPVNQLDALWTGDFLLLWRNGAGTDRIAPTTVGAPVVWLRTQLAKAAHQPLAMPVSDSFDAGLRQKLVAFQAAQGLDRDGLIGTRSLIALSSVGAQAGVPTLKDSLN